MSTTVTDCVIRHLASAANDTIRRHELMELTERDSLRFARAELDPPDPNQALQDADRRYRQRRGERGMPVDRPGA